MATKTVEYIECLQSLGLTPSDPAPSFRHYRAQDLHALTNMQATLDLNFALLELSRRITNQNSYFHLLYGACKRTRFIWDATRSLYGICPPDRNKPLKTEEVDSASRALNDIYIHMRGTLDNLAWAILFQFSSKTTKIRDIDVSLFRDKFRDDPNLLPFSEVCAPFKNWEKEMKRRRDPVAHRIPLTVPPSILTEEERKQREAAERHFFNLSNNFLDALRRNVEEETRKHMEEILDEAKNKIENIGTFHPMLAHDPNERLTPIYPTIPNDLKNFVDLCTALEFSILERI